MVPYTDTEKQTFLDALAKCGIVSDALKVAGIKSRVTINNWCRDDAEFKAGYEEAVATAADTLEAEARRRAVEGVIRAKMIGKGDDARLIDEVHYSDPLLIALLKANKPDKFAERSKTELSNPDGTFKPENETAAAARIAALLDGARHRRDSEEDDLFQ